MILIWLNLSYILLLPTPRSNWQILSFQPAALSIAVCSCAVVISLLSWTNKNREWDVSLSKGVPSLLTGEMFIVSSKFYVAVVQLPSVKYLTLLQYCSRLPIAHQRNTLWWGYWLGFITMLYASSTSRCLHVSRVYVMSEDFILFLFTWFCAHLSPPWQSIKTVLLILRLR